jgi:hypothetical protein
MGSRIAATAVLAVLLAGATAAPLAAGQVEKSAPFALDQLIELGATDGPATLHRIRLVRASGFTKSKLVRPGNSEYLTDVQVQLEYSNDATRDWEARLDIEWLDAEGRPIDGYDDRESLDSDARFEQQTVTLSTLRYGLERAKTIQVRIEFHPD